MLTPVYRLGRQALPARRHAMHTASMRARPLHQHRAQQARAARETDCLHENDSAGLAAERRRWQPSLSSRAEPARGSHNPYTEPVRSNVVVGMAA